MEWQTPNEAVREITFGKIANRPFKGVERVIFFSEVADRVVLDTKPVVFFTSIEDLIFGILF